jgi:Sec-independent protein secretion pathway component TatC
MYCKRCDYNLATLQHGPCPECGGPFDPAVSSSYSRLSNAALASRDKRLWRVLIVCNIIVVSPLVFASLAACVARIELGRWPVSMRDDPKSLRLVGPFDELFWASSLIALFAIIALLVTAATAIFIGLHHRRTRWIAAGCAGLIGPVLFFVGVLFSRHVEWMLD